MPENTGISIGMVAVYGLFNLTPKFRSPDNNNKINTPICINPTRAKQSNLFERKISVKNYGTYIGQHVNHSNGTKLELKFPIHHCFLKHNIKISESKKHKLLC